MYMTASAQISSTNSSLNVIARIKACYAVARQRTALRSLDADQLRDLGLTEGDALREAMRPFWA